MPRITKPAPKLTTGGEYLGPYPAEALEPIKRPRWRRWRRSVEARLEALERPNAK